MWGNQTRSVEPFEDGIIDVQSLRSQNRRLKTKLADLEDLHAKTKARLKSQLREKSKAKRGDPARFERPRPSSRAASNQNHKLERVKKEYEEMKKKYLAMSSELRKTRRELTTLKTTSRDNLAKQKSINAKIQKKLTAAESERNDWKSKFENLKKKVKVQSGDLSSRGSNSSSIRSRRRTYSERLNLKKRNASKSRERSRGDKATAHSRTRSSPMYSTISAPKDSLSNASSKDPLIRKKTSPAPRARPRIERKSRSKSTLKAKRKGSMDLEKERELQFSEKPKLPKWTPYVMSSSKSSSKKRKLSKKLVNKTKSKTGVKIERRGTRKPRSRRNALVPFDLSSKHTYGKRSQKPVEKEVLVPEALSSEAKKSKPRSLRKKRKVASSAVPQVQLIKRKAAIETRQAPQREESSLDSEMLENGVRDSVTDVLDPSLLETESHDESFRDDLSFEGDDARREKFVAEIRRQSEEIMNSIKYPSSASKQSEMMTPPPRSFSREEELDDLTETRMQVDDLRRKSIQMLEALESPTGIEDFHLTPEISPKGKDLESDQESEISDLEETMDVNSQKQLVENIQLPPSDEKSEFSDYSSMRRESEELLTAIQFEEATSATRTPQNTPLPSQTNTPQNTPIIEPESPLQKVRLELRKLSEDIMQKNVDSRSPSSDLVKSVLVMKHKRDSPSGTGFKEWDNSMEMAYPHTPTADDEMDSFENLLEEERKGPLVDDMDDISDSLSDLENAAPLTNGDSSDGEDFEPQAYELKGAGSEEFNGVYRWFHATNSFVKFEPAGATYTMNSEPFGDSALMWYISKIDENNVLHQFYSSFHKGTHPPERWQSVIGELPAPTLSSYMDESEN